MFVDEVHRFNKSQQDAFLPFVERGLFTFIGATTENPSFEVNSALLSRASVYVLQPLADADMDVLIDRALATTDTARSIAGAARRLITSYADGDARRLLNMMEQIEVAAAMVDAAVIEEALVRSTLAHIGLADPRALRLTLDACETYERLGSPEGELALAQAVLYLAVAPKSNAAYKAYNAARALIRDDGTRPVPAHLRNAPTRLMKELGYGRDYRYAHDEATAYAAGEN